MKIVHVCIASNVFGEKYAYQDNLLSKYHRKMGHDVTIIAPTYSEFDINNGVVIREDIGTTFLTNGIKLIRLRPLLPYRINQHFHLFQDFYKVLQNENPDLLYCHSVGLFNYLVVPRYKRKHPNVQIVFDSHADYLNSWHSKLSYWDSRYIQRHFIVNQCSKVANWFYGVTPIRCDVLHDVYGVDKKKIKLLPMGADDDNLNLKDRDEIRYEIRKRFFVNEDDFLIVTGGKIDKTKNVHVLADAVTQLDNEHVKLMIFGNVVDEMKPYFRAINSEKIIQIGWIPSDQVYNYFFAADLVIFPGLHSVLWEQAVASKVPCAVRKITGFEHIDLGGNCIFLEENTAEYYKSVITNILTDKEAYLRMKVASESNQSNAFLYSTIAKKVIDDNFFSSN